MRSDAEAPEDAQGAIACERLISQFQQVTVTPDGHAALARCGRPPRTLEALRPSDDPPGGLLDSENKVSPLLQKLG